MSIIHEALKKAAQIKKDNETAQETGYTLQREPDVKITSISPDAQKTRVKKSNPTIRIVPFAFAAALIAVAVFLIYNYRNLKEKEPEMPPIVQQASKAPLESIAPLTTKGPLPKQDSSNKYVLSGIVYEDKEPMAIINDAIYVIGDNVKGAQVVEITNNRVLLRKSGKLIELKVK